MNIYRKGLIALLLCLLLLGIGILSPTVSDRTGTLTRQLMTIAGGLFITPMPAYADFDSDAPATTIQPPQGVRSTSVLFLPELLQYGRQLLPIGFLGSICLFSLVLIVRRRRSSIKTNKKTDKQ